LNVTDREKGDASGRESEKVNGEATRCHGGPEDASANGTLRALSGRSNASGNADGYKSGSVEMPEFELT